MAAPEGTTGATLTASPGNVRHASGDPLEDVNRYFFEINMLVDDVVLEPTARVYRFVVPKPGRRGVANFLRNLDSPVIFANDLLQGEWDRAWTTTARFGINSTIGVLGVFDPAAGWGLSRHSEDFGQTLAVHGAGSGPYLMVPFLGPSNPRDLAGFAVDQVFDPLTWVGGDSIEYVSIGKFALGLISNREQLIEPLDEIERTSIDMYTQVRSVYNQRRSSEIKNGRNEFDDLPDLSEFDIQ